MYLWIPVSSSGVCLCLFDSGYVLPGKVHHEQGVIRQAAAAHRALWKRRPRCRARSDQLLCQRTTVCIALKNIANC